MSSDEVTPDAGPRFVDDDGRVYYGVEALAAADAHFARSEREHRAAVERMRAKPTVWRAYKTRLRIGTWKARGHAPRRPCNAHTRGSRRVASASSGQDPDDPDPELPHELAPVLCGGAGA